MHSLAAAIDRNRARVRYQYPTRLPLPRYRAWEILTDAMGHINAHGRTIAPDTVELDAGDWEAFALLNQTRAALCTPR
jgi:hypothetical protein